MVRKRSLPAAILLVGALVALSAGFVSSRRLAAERREREAHFIAIHAVAMEARANAGVPEDFDGLMEAHGGRESPLPRPFPDGLVFHVQGASFLLEEPRARPVSLWRKDRLVATNL